MTTIEWTHRPGTTGESWNPIRARVKATGKVGHHCEHVTEACRFCYAERLQPRFGGLAFKPGNREKLHIFVDDAMLVKPLGWKAPRTIFVCSMSDLFGDWIEDAWLDRIFAVMALAPQHTFIVLTKRPERMRRYLSYIGNRDDLVAEAARRLAKVADAEAADWRREFARRILRGLPNVWLGVSIGDQADADRFIPPLLETPAAIRFVSYEPALGPVNFEAYLHQWDGIVVEPLCDDCGGRHRGACIGLDWVICGGESGPGARPMHPDWVRSARDQCAAAGVPFFFKQWGRWEPFEHVFPDGTAMLPVGKKRAGRLLDGVEHAGWPA